MVLLLPARGLLLCSGTNYWASGAIGRNRYLCRVASTLNIISACGHYLSGGILTNNGTVVDTGG